MKNNRIAYFSIASFIVALLMMAAPVPAEKLSANTSVSVCQKLQDCPQKKMQTATHAATLNGLDVFIR